MTNVDPTILEKIAKLLQLAEGNANVNEASVAAQKAQELLSRYRLTQADLSTPTNKEDIKTSGIGLIFGQKLAYWKEVLAQTLVETNGCKCYYWKNNSGVKHLKMVGRESDMQIISYFNDYLTLEIERLADVALSRGEVAGKRGSTSFKLGASMAVISRLKEANNKIRREASSTSAIVKLNSADLEVQDFYKKLSKELKLKTVHSTTVSPEYDSYNQGREAGNRIVLNKGIGGKQVKELS